MDKTRRLFSSACHKWSEKKNIDFAGKVEWNHVSITSTKEGKLPEEALLNCFK